MENRNTRRKVIAASGAGEACANCRFYYFAEKELANPCRRFPPQNVPKNFGEEFRSQFPMMLPEGWCGEWQLKGPPERKAAKPKVKGS